EVSFFFAPLTPGSSSGGTSTRPSMTPTTPRCTVGIDPAGVPRIAALTQYWPGPSGVNGTAKTPFLTSLAGNWRLAPSGPWRSDDDVVVAGGGRAERSLDHRSAVEQRQQRMLHRLGEVERALAIGRCRREQAALQVANLELRHERGTPVGRGGPDARTGCGEE